MQGRPAESGIRERRQGVQSAEMGLGILKALARLGGSASLTGIAQEVGQSTAKAHRYMVSLVEAGLVEQDPASQRYFLGREAIHIGLAALRQCDPVRAGEPALLRLRDQLGVTCFLAVMGNLGPTILRLQEPALPVTVNARPGSVLPLLWSAAGQVFLAYSDDATVLRQARAEWKAGSAQQRGAFGNRSPIEALRSTVRNAGCAEIRDLQLPGISAVAAPVRDHAGRVVAALTALGASGGFDPSADGPVGSRVCEEARLISSALGFSG